MDVVRSWQEVPQHLKGASLAIGTFDGVHCGHRAVLDAAKAKAAEIGRPMGVMVFEPLSQGVLSAAKAVLPADEPSAQA